MYKVKARKSNAQRRSVRVRGKVSGTSQRPRLFVNRSNKYTYAGIVDDAKGHVLVGIFSEVKKLSEKGNKVEAAFEVGKSLAAKATKKGIKRVVFDRKGMKYHGRVKSLAEGAREGGLEF